MENDTSTRSWLRGRQVLCLFLTVAAAVYVLAQINWKDSLVQESGRITGWVEHAKNGARVFHADDGTAHVMSGDQAGKGVFIPGLGTIFREINLGLLLVSFLTFPIPLLLMAWRWQLLLKSDGIDPGWREVLRLTWIGALAGTFLPGAAGVDVANIVCMCRRAPDKRLAAVLSVFMCRFLGMATLILLGALALVSQVDRPELGVATTIVWSWLGAMLAGGVLLFSRRLRSWFRLDRLLPRLPLGRQLARMDEYFLHYRRRWDILLLGAMLSLVLHCCTTLSVWLLGMAVGIELPIVDYFILLPIVFIAGAVAPSINGLGVREAAFQFFFGLVGVAASQAVALSLVHRCLALLITLPGAIPLYRELSSRAHGDATAVPCTRRIAA